jgi:plasmid stabilization system protein ParE
VPKAKPWRLAESAEARLAEIMAWTEQTFGPKQTDVYLAALIGSIESVADGSVQGRSCRAVFGESLPEDLHFVRSGRHIVVYVELPKALVVTNFIHVSSDIISRLLDGS